VSCLSKLVPKFKLTRAFLPACSIDYVVPVQETNIEDPKQNTKQYADKNTKSGNTIMVSSSPLLSSPLLSSPLLSSPLPSPSLSLPNQPLTDIFHSERFAGLVEGQSFILL
jgi:hypothetical protein